MPPSASHALFEPKIAPDLARITQQWSESFGTGAAMKSLTEKLRASTLASSRLSESFGTGAAMKSLTEQLRASTLASSRLSESFGTGAAMKSLTEQLRASTLASSRLSESFGTGAAMKSLTEELRVASQAAYQWSESAGAAETATLWSDLTESLGSLDISVDPLEQRAADDRALSALATWYLGLPARHRRAIVNSLLGIVFTTCVFIQSAVPHRAPPAILNAMSWLISVILLCTAISDANDDDR